MKYIIRAIAALICFAANSAAFAQHAGDVFLGVDGGRIFTGRIDQQQNITWPVRVVAATFGDSGCQPFTANPGFDSLPGTFAVGTRVGWNAVDGLKVWNGDGFDLVDNETLVLSFQSAMFTVGAAPANGFSLFVQADGGFHRHLDFCMNGCPNGCAPPPGAENGIYLLSLEMYSDAAALESSEHFWIVFNYGDAAANQQQAIAWVENNLIEQCPADLAGDDGAVDVFDLFVLLDNWGADGPGADLAEPNDVVDVFDLFVLLDAWGDCAP